MTDQFTPTKIVAVLDDGSPPAPKPPTHEEAAAMRRVCDAIKSWARAMDEEHGEDPEWRGQIAAVQSTILLIHKSNCLWRMLYRGEPLRTRKCPKHAGKWSGLPTEENWCECGLTGWLPEQGEYVEPFWRDAKTGLPRATKEPT